MTAGDLNQDGQLTRADLDILKRLLADNTLDWSTVPPELKQRLDVNGDGQVDEADLEMLCQQLAVAGGVESDKLSKLQSIRDRLRQ